MKKIHLFLILSSIFITISAIIAFTATSVLGQSTGQGTFEDPIQNYASSTSVWVGKNIPSVVADARVGRTYLEISNISGATSTAQAIYCAVGATPTAYNGIVIQASSTRTWEKSHIPVGQVKCIAPISSSTVTVVSR